MSRKVWVATASDHDYDVGSDWTIGVFETLAGAKVFCDERYGPGMAPWFDGDDSRSVRTFPPPHPLWQVVVEVEIEEFEVRP